MSVLHDLMEHSESWRKYLVKHQNQTDFNDIALKNIESLEQVHEVEDVAAVEQSACIIIAIALMHSHYSLVCIFVHIFGPIAASMSMKELAQVDSAGADLDWTSLDLKKWLQSFAVADGDAPGEPSPTPRVPSSTWGLSFVGSASGSE